MVSSQALPRAVKVSRFYPGTTQPLDDALRNHLCSVSRCGGPGQKDIKELRTALQSVDRWLGKLGKQYPVAVFHEDFTAHLMHDLQSRLRLSLIFVRVAFRLPEALRARHEANRGVFVRRWSGNKVSPTAEAGVGGVEAPRVRKAATSRAEPRQKQDWILKCPQGGRAHPLAACGVATLCCSTGDAGNRTPLRYSLTMVYSAPRGLDTAHTTVLERTAIARVSSCDTH